MRWDEVSFTWTWYHSMLPWPWPCLVLHRLSLDRSHARFSFPYPSHLGHLYNQCELMSNTDTVVALVWGAFQILHMGSVFLITQSTPFGNHLTYTSLFVMMIGAKSIIVGIYTCVGWFQRVHRGSVFLIMRFSLFGNHLTHFCALSVTTPTPNGWRHFFDVPCQCHLL